jgi:hypothetical protein
MVQQLFPRECSFLGFKRRKISAVTSSNSPATVAALVDSLRYDPFYVAITEEFADNEARRRQALALYFDYSMSEGARVGRLVVWPDPAVGAAVWFACGNIGVSGRGEGQS